MLFAELTDAGIATIVSGVVTVAGMLVGFFTMWAKLKHAGTKAEEAVKATELVEKKLDSNTATTDSLVIKADTIVKQTDGTMEAMMRLVEGIAGRVNKLEDYNRDASHRVLNALNDVNLKVTAIQAIQAVQAVSQPKATESGVNLEGQS